jgi:excisionase family DNA binding protein
MPTTVPSTLSVEQASEILGLPVRTTYRAAARGEIPSLRIGRRVLVPTGRLLELLGLAAEDVTGLIDVEKATAG